MQSLTLKNATKFTINQAVSISDDQNEIGTIAPDTPRTLTVESRIFEVFNATFMETIQESIFVLNDDAELQAVNEYKRSESFKVFYDTADHILYSTAPSLISRNFFKALQKTIPQDVEISNFDFDFQKIQRRLNSTRGIAFTTEEEGVQKKRFTGDNVEANQEAGEALLDDTTTFLIGKMDVLRRERTIGFTKSGALLMYSSLSDIDFEHPFLNAARAIVEIIN